MRKIGALASSSLEFMRGFKKLVISSRTRFVGPVRPFSEGLWTERPQPRWSKEYVVMPRLARVGKRMP
jgi:hypothetical protein